MQNNIELVNTGGLMVKKTCSIAETMEMADRNTQEFHPSSSQTIQANKVLEEESENTDRLPCPTVVVG